MLNVTVKRSEWGKGDGTFNSFLYNPVTHMRCCLGFAGNAAGISDEQMACIRTPGKLEEEENLIILDSLRVQGRGIGVIEHVCNRLMWTNDSPAISEEERESRLTELGKEAGINFTFVD